VLLVLAWLRFQYRVSADTIQVQQGIFTRQSLTLEFDRIQNVRIETPIYLRPFGLARLSIESAGSSSEEVHLPRHSHSTRGNPPGQGACLTC